MTLSPSEARNLFVSHGFSGPDAARAVRDLQRLKEGLTTQLVEEAAARRAERQRVRFRPTASPVAYVEASSADDLHQDVQQFVRASVNALRYQLFEADEAPFDSRTAREWLEAYAWDEAEQAAAVERVAAACTPLFTTLQELGLELPEQIEVAKDHVRVPGSAARVVVRPGSPPGILARSARSLREVLPIDADEFSDHVLVGTELTLRLVEFKTTTRRVSASREGWGEGERPKDFDYPILDMRFYVPPTADEWHRTLRRRVTQAWGHGGPNLRNPLSPFERNVWDAATSADPPIGESGWVELRGSLDPKYRKKSWTAVRAAYYRADKKTEGTR